MPGVISHFLGREDERAALAERGRRFVTEHLTMERSLARIAELLGAHLARGR